MGKATHPAELKLLQNLSAIASVGAVPAVAWVRIQAKPGLKQHVHEFCFMDSPGSPGAGPDGGSPLAADTWQHLVLPGAGSAA